MFDCDTCGKPKKESSFNRESFSPDTCFRCRVSGVGFTNPIRSGQGDDQWKHSTIKEAQRIQVKEARDNGLDPVPKNYAGGHTPSRKQLSTIKKAQEKVAKVKSDA